MDFLTLWRALAPGDLPGPVPEYRFHPVRRWRFDWAWPGPGRGGVAVEIDGGQWRAGGGRHNGDPDREKLNTAAALGWRVLRFSHTALETDPAHCVELAAAALVLSGDGQLADDLDPVQWGADPRGGAADQDLAELARAAGLELASTAPQLQRRGLQLARPQQRRAGGAGAPLGPALAGDL